MARCLMEFRGLGVVSLFSHLDRADVPSTIVSDTSHNPVGWGDTIGDDRLASFFVSRY